MEVVSTKCNMVLSHQTIYPKGIPFPGSISIWVTMPQVLQLSSRAVSWHFGDIYLSAYARAFTEFLASVTMRNPTVGLR